MFVGNRVIYGLETPIIFLTLINLTIVILCI